MKTTEINLGPLDKISLGHGLCYVVEGVDVAVFRSRSGQIFAIENRCPHRNGPLAEGIIDGQYVVCPLHGHKFNLATGDGLEKGECVRTFKAWEKDKNIFIEYTK